VVRLKTTFKKDGTVTTELDKDERTPTEIATAARSAPTTGDTSAGEPDAAANGELRKLLDAAGVGVELGPSMAAVRAIVRRLAEVRDDMPHVMPALDIIHTTAGVAMHLKMAASLGKVVGFDPGRTMTEVRTILATMPPDAAGERIAVAKLVLNEGARRDANRTIVDAKAVVKNALAHVVHNAPRYGRAEAPGGGAGDDPAREQIAHEVADLILGSTGTRPPLDLVHDALNVAARRRGRPKLGEEPEFKDIVLERLLVCLGYEPSNLYALLREIKSEK
jgi:hypothetical protein